MKSERIVVPTREVNGGFDSKFETDPYNVKLYGMLTADEYTDCITRVNDTIRPARSNQLDTALLITGPLLVPLGVWGVRHAIQVKKRKKLLKQAIQEFNSQHPGLLMRWNRRPVSRLTIERRSGENISMSTPSVEPNGSEIIVYAQPINNGASHTTTTESHPLL